MTQAERNGLKKLKKKISETDLVIGKTDKTGKLCALNLEEYRKGGLEHTQKDKEINRQDTKKIQRILNGHTSSWGKMTNMGKDNIQKQRIRNNMMNYDAAVPT